MHSRSINWIVVVGLAICLFSSISTAAGTAPGLPGWEGQLRGINYVTRDHQYRLDAIVENDMRRFAADGIDLINVSIYWYKVEPVVDVYDREFLQDVRKFIECAYKHGLRTLVTMHTVWGNADAWSLPAYVIDPTNGKRQALAILHSDSIRESFLRMYEKMVTALAGTPGIWAFAMLNEPWYYPLTDSDKQAFIEIVTRQHSIHARLTPSIPVTIRFINDKALESGTVINMFARDWGYDSRLLINLDFVGLNFYPYSTGHDEQLFAIRSTNLQANIDKLTQMRLPVLITEFGDNTADPAMQEKGYSNMIKLFKSIPQLQGWMPWAWLSEPFFTSNYNLKTSTGTAPGYQVFISNSTD